MRKEPRPYQQAAHDAVWASLGREVQSGMCVMPTGTGKTFVAAMVAETAKTQLGSRTLFLCNREILAIQAERTLKDHGLDVLVEMSANRAYKQRRLTGDPDVVVATVQTMHERRLDDHWPGHYFGMIIQDECHHANTKSHRSVREHFPNALYLGITATPSGGKFLGNVFEKKLYEYKIGNAIREGYLSPIHIQRVPIVVNLSGLSTRNNGDWSGGDLSERISPQVEELADGIISYAKDRYTVVFTPDVGCALAMAQALSGMGMEARYVAGTGGRFGMSKRERRAILRAFNRCEFQTIVCCDLLFEGWDAPHVSCVVNCRPTRKLYRFQQEVGRGTRPCDEIGKEDLLVIDFDWRTSQNARDLASVMDLYTGEIDDERVAKRAQKTASAKEAKGLEVDPEAEIDAALRWVRDRDRMVVQLTGKKLRLAAKPFTYDPIGVSKLLGMKLVRRYDINTDRAGEATQKQVNTLKMLGCREPGKISKWGASKLISSLIKRREGGLATVGQLADLRSAGVSASVATVMSTTEASNFLDRTSKQMDLKWED